MQTRRIMLGNGKRIQENVRLTIDKLATCTVAKDLFIPNIHYS